MKTKWFRSILLTLCLAGCASPRPASLDFYVNIGTEIDSLRAEIARDRASHVGLLAPGELDRAELHLKRAADARRAEAVRNDVVEELGLAHAHLDEAARLVRDRTPLAAEVLAGREAALNAGVLRDVATARGFRELGQRIRTGGARRIADRERLTAAYARLEARAVVDRELRGPREALARAREPNVRGVAPLAATAAEAAVAEAERVVRAHPRRPDEYADAVATAVRRAQTLDTVVARALEVRGRSPEDLAAELIVRRREVDQLRSELAAVELNVAVKDQGLRRAVTENEFNAVLERVREGLVASDADVSRAGDELLIRLKSGAGPTVSKVKGVIQDLKPSDVRVQGGAPVEAAELARTLSDVTNVARTVDPAAPLDAPLEVLVKPTGELTEPAGEPATAL